MHWRNFTITLEVIVSPGLHFMFHLSFDNFHFTSSYTVKTFISLKWIYETKSTADIYFHTVTNFSYISSLCTAKLPLQTSHFNTDTKLHFNLTPLYRSGSRFPWRIFALGLIKKNKNTLMLKGKFCQHLPVRTTASETIK